MKVHYIFLFLIIIMASCKDNDDNNYVLFYENQFNQEDNNWEYYSETSDLDEDLWSRTYEWFLDNPAYYSIENGELLLHSSFYECWTLSAKARLRFSDIKFDSFLKGESLIKIGVSNFYFSTSTDYPPTPNIDIYLNNYRYSLSQGYKDWERENTKTLNNSYFVIEYYMQNYEIIAVKLNGSNITQSIYRREFSENNNFIEIMCSSGIGMCMGEGNLDISIDYVELYYKP